MTPALLILGFTALVITAGIVLERIAARHKDDTYDPWPRSDRGGRRD